MVTIQLNIVTFCLICYLIIKAINVKEEEPKSIVKLGIAVYGSLFIIDVM